MATTALAAVPEQGDRDLSALSLDELADLANEQHLLVEETFRRTIDYAIRSGEALSAARAAQLEEDWPSWRDSHFAGSETTANFYIRLATYQERIPPGITLGQGRDLLRGLPIVRFYRPIIEASGAAAAAKALKREGKTLKQIAETLGVSEPTAVRYVDPVRARERDKRSKARRRRAKAALAAQEREKDIRAAVKSSGKGVSKFYASLERMQDELAEARAEVDDLGDTQALFHRLRDEFVSKALGVS